MIVKEREENIGNELNFLSFENSEVSVFGIESDDNDEK